MRRILHIVTNTHGDLAQSVIDTQKAETGVELVVRDVAHGDVDHDELLAAIFEADSVQVW